MNSKKKFEDNRSADRSQLSLQQGFQEVDLLGSQKIFSFNQSFGLVEHNEKSNQQKISSPSSKAKSNDQQQKLNKARSALWQKTKSEIINLNKYLKLSSLSLGCSDSAIMKQFFESIHELLLSKQGKSKEDRNKIAETKKKQAELFQKLVQSNKKKYQLQQIIVHYQHQISKLTDINETLREKSRAQSTERSSKVREFHQDTLMTIHLKESELSNLEEQNKQQKLEIIRLQEAIQNLIIELQMKQGLLKKQKELCVQMQEENNNLRKQITNLKQEQQQTCMTFVSLKQELQTIVADNESIRLEIRKKDEEVKRLKAIIQNAKVVNEEFINFTQLQQQQSQAKKQYKIDQLLRKQQILKKKLVNSIHFTSQRRKQRKYIKKKQSQPLVLRLQI